MPNHRKLHFLNFRSNKQVAGKDCNKQDAVPIRGSKYASLIPGCCSFVNICVTYPSSPKFGGCLAVPDIYVSGCSCLEAGFLMKDMPNTGHQQQRTALPWAAQVGTPSLSWDALPCKELSRDQSGERGGDSFTRVHEAPTQPLQEPPCPALCVLEKLRRSCAIVGHRPSQRKGEAGTPTSKSKSSNSLQVYVVFTTVFARVHSSHSQSPVEEPKFQVAFPLALLRMCSTFVVSNGGAVCLSTTCPYSCGTIQV